VVRAAASALDDRLDVSQALPFPKALQLWARTSFSLLSAAMTGSPILSRLAVSEIFGAAARLDREGPLSSREAGEQA
jgi:hypothetical protein